MVNIGSEKSQHWQRVYPVVGDHLHSKRVAMIGSAPSAPIMDCLCACGVGTWLIHSMGDAWVSGQVERIRARHGDELALAAVIVGEDAWLNQIQNWQADLVICVGVADQLLHTILGMLNEETPLLSIKPPTQGDPCRAIICLPTDCKREWASETTGLLHTDVELSVALDKWGWVTSAYLLAGLARALLLRHTGHTRPDLERIWQAGYRSMTIGACDNPLSGEWSRRLSIVEPSGRSNFSTPARRRGSLLVVGLGSLGSIAADYLARYVERLVLVDPDQVDSANPVRQAFFLTMRGMNKAQALKLGIGQNDSVVGVVTLCEALTETTRVIEIVQKYAITGALVVTGTSADFAVARGLRELEIPHVVGRCYPRANYWEAMLVDGKCGPSLDELRGHIGAFPLPTPTPEQRAAYVDPSALNAEPATLVESGWAAAWLARLTHQLLQPPGLRERWLLELLSQEAVCLIGGVSVNQTEFGPAYGISHPGQIRPWQRHAIATRCSKSASQQA